jgi:hypothetical protein
MRKMSFAELILILRQSLRTHVLRGKNPIHATLKGRFLTFIKTNFYDRSIHGDNEY